MRPSASLSKDGADVDLGQSIALLLLLTQGNGVCNNKLSENGIVQVLNSLAGQNTVSDDRENLLGTVLHNHSSGLAKGTASISHVIDDDSCKALDVTD